MKEWDKRQYLRNNTNFWQAFDSLKQAVPLKNYNCRGYEYCGPVYQPMKNKLKSDTDTARATFFKAQKPWHNRDSTS